MTKKARRAPDEARTQPYDNVLKRLVEHQPTILPRLLPHLVCDLLDPLTIEVLLPPRRADRAYRVRTPLGIAILHAEYETSANGKMDKRLLVYHALFFEEYELPVISVIIYPFEVTMAEPPLRETFGEEEILRFQYQALCLRSLDARTFIEAGEVPVYGLLPCMDQVSEGLLQQAIEEMIHYYGKGNDLLRDELLCFLVLLQRADPLPEIEMERVLRRVRMFDPLLEEDPWVKEKVAQGELRGEAKGVREGELRSARSILINIVGKRFPHLRELAAAQAAHIGQPEILGILVEQVALAADESAVRALLEKATAS